MTEPAATAPERECPECTRRGFAPDNRWPETSQFWPKHSGRLIFRMCRACRQQYLVESERRFRELCRRNARRREAHA